MTRRLISAAEIVERSVGWLWPDRIPLRAITNFDGDPSSAFLLPYRGSVLPEKIRFQRNTRRGA